MDGWMMKYEYFNVINEYFALQCDVLQTEFGKLEDLSLVSVFEDGLGVGVGTMACSHHPGEHEGATHGFFDVFL